MRVTNRMMNNTLLLNLNRGLARLERINNQLGTKKKINRPSDDPVKTGVILRTSTSIRETEQYIRNLDAAVSWLDAADVILQDVVSVIHRAKELAVAGASTHLDETARQALADEIAQLHDNLLQLANSTHGGRYLFAGQHTDKKPFSGGGVTGDRINDVTFLMSLTGDETKIEFEIAPGITIDVNVISYNPDDNPQEGLFMPIFNALQELYGELVDDTGDPDIPLQDLDNSLDNVLRKISELGGKQNRVELARERMLDLQLNLTRILSEEQDLDYAEAIMELKMEEFAYRTALAVGARIIQPSLVDFLR
ncbi:flagellar hook-associated protein FlgL [Candidatus Darwinibacter acetoxidans]|jgi:flagellar hook-associated protein 3 FlgL|nr:flagellar hook-associated protein FlgL [Limnochordia bacterium]HOK31464.1 flagellar hook-associated protein FlgL [Limnochordia bacterium]HPP73245.1 flagellar hook-associated protein FlgL [Limnochordia bacterium]HQE36322.1 flagellar hook-associated protein FlgL [Limnochordia bacterium]